MKGNLTELMKQRHYCFGCCEHELAKSYSTKERDGYVYVSFECSYCGSQMEGNVFRELTEEPMVALVEQERELLIDDAPVVAVSTEPRRRGRPPGSKNKNAALARAAVLAGRPQKRRGRPRKA